MKSALARTSNAILHMLLGGIVFWTPNVAVHWVRGYRFTVYEAMGLALVLPAVTFLFFRVFWSAVGKQDERLSSALFAVLGIWIAGPSMLTFSETFCGGGLSQPGAWHFFVFGTLLFPLFTLILSTYDGALFAVLLATVLLPVFANFRFKRSSEALGLDPSYVAGAPTGRPTK
jgi:hypothetical protein